MTASARSLELKNGQFCYARRDARRFLVSAKNNKNIDDAANYLAMEAIAAAPQCLRVDVAAGGGAVEGDLTPLPRDFDPPPVPLEEGGGDRVCALL